MTASRPRYPTEVSGSRETTQRALDQVSLDIDQLNADLAAVPYTPANSADWVAPPPTSLQDAIDRIAAAIGPVP